MDRIIAAQVFVTIAERGSLSSAAELLDMSRAMVTRYLAEMENWSGTRLFHRTTRRINLTSAGEATLVRCRDMLALAEQMSAVSNTEKDEPRGILRIACSQALAQDSLSAAIAAYLRQYPRTAVELRIDNRTVNLVEDRIDLAIRITNQLDPGLIARRLGDCPSVICASPAYLKEHGIPKNAEDLAVHNCLTYSYFGKNLWNFERVGEPLSVPVSGNFSANDSVVILRAALEGAGIAMQPVMSAAPYIASGQLVALVPKDKPITLGIHGVYMSRQNQALIMRSMLDFLTQWFASTKT
ncbi:LysR family transcriptional regulator [Undibacterium sp. SXout11W]|uniref:LysR family transcriptional regulator n=1 Tax=Undibacterium sp. SXout11W TaxID=3413050 RepID=UPI003BF160C6